MVTINFEKVFVALDHELQIKVLYTFSLGHPFFSGFELSIQTFKAAS